MTLSLEQLREQASVHHRGGLFSNFKSEDAILSVMLLGQELGLSPAQTLTACHVMGGKLVLSAGLMANLILRTGKYSYVVTYNDDSTAVTLECFAHREGQAPIPLGVSTFTMDDAKAAGIVNNPNWKKYPRNMLFARALANACRWYFSDAIGAGAVYTEEEMESVAEEKEVKRAPALPSVKALPEKKKDADTAPVTYYKKAMAYVRKTLMDGQFSEEEHARIWDQAVAIGVDYPNHNDEEKLKPLFTALFQKT